MDRNTKALSYRAAFIGGLVDYKTVQGYTQADGTRTEAINARLMTGKKWTRKGNRTIIDLADIDREALKQQFPFETFTVADWPEIFEGHVGRRIAQGVGTVVKTPLTWISKSGGVWKFAGPKTVGGAATLLAVYRGKQPTQGALVNSSEYTASTATGASTGVQVNTVNFTREQIDLDGQPFVMEADWTLPGTRTAPAELARVLALFGIATDATTFNAADTYDAASGFLMDALYWGDTNGIAGNTIVENLLRVARAWIMPTSTGAWALAQDTARASVLSVDTTPDKFVIEEYGDGDIEKTVTVQYRPSSSTGEDFTGKLARTTAGITGERVIALPYVRDHVVADRIASYWQKRLNTYRVASGYATGMQLKSNDVITVTDANAFVGTKDFIIRGISRPGDRNDLKLREYDPNVYVYTAGTLPANATTGYSPDYSYTLPLAPTGLAVISQGTAVDADGKISSYALIRATPPTVNWKRIVAQVKNSTTNEIYQAELLLNGGNYEAVIGGLRPNQAHTVVAWAVNSNNVDGVTSSPVSFTSATNANVPTTPTPAAIGQLYTRELDYSWAASTPGSGAPPIKEYVVEESVGGGAFAQVQLVAAPLTTYKRVGVSVGASIQMRVKARDRVGNESAYATSGSVAVQQMITDSYIAGSGISGASIANGSISSGRTSNTTGSTSGTIGPGSTTQVSFATAAADFTFYLSATCGPSFSFLTQMIPNNANSIAFANNTGVNPMSYAVAYRALT